MATETRMTIEDVLRLAAAGESYELIDGELVPMSPTGFIHGEIELHVGEVLNNHVRPRRLGRVVVGDVLFQLDQAGHVARAADVAFTRRERIQGQSNLVGAFVGAPDLAVEVVSPSNSAEDIQKKVRDWLTYGTLAVLVMFPTDRGVVLWRKSGAIALSVDDVLDLDPAVPGFRCTVSDLFPPPLDEA